MAKKETTPKATETIEVVVKAKALIPLVTDEFGREDLNRLRDVLNMLVNKENAKAD